MKIEGTNIAILNKLDRTRREITRSLQKLSSGSRLPDFRANSADAARLVNLTAKFNEFTHRIKNINSAQGLLGTTSTAISALTDIVQRMRELSVQAADGTLSTKDRENITKELMSLRSEYDRVVQDTEFNGIKPLNGSTSSLQLDGSDLQLPHLSFAQSFTKSVPTGNFTRDQDLLIDSGKPTNVTLADVDNDGDLDALFHNGSQRLDVGLNDGQGNFSFLPTASALPQIEDFKVADLNGDGLVDIVGEYGGTLAIMFGLGDGQFTLGQTFAVNSLADVAIADLDNDGDMDIVTSHTTNKVIAMYENNGEGAFSLRSTFMSAYLGEMIQVGDFDGDGYQDIANGDATENRVQISFGNGAFSVSATTTVNGSGSLVLLFRSGDLNNDGISDVAVVEQNSDVSIFYGGSNRSFTEYSPTSTGTTGESSMELTDINGDGLLDILLVERNTSNIYWLENSLSGTAFNQSHQLNANGGSLVSATTGDINGDGLKDIVTSDWSPHSLLKLFSIGRDQSASSELNMQSAADAQELIALFDDLLERLLRAQTQISLTQNQLDYRTNFLSVQADNHAAAIDQLNSLDIAEETSNLVRLQILEQAQIAALTQGNLQMQMVLQLLRND